MPRLGVVFGGAGHGDEVESRVVVAVVVACGGHVDDVGERCRSDSVAQAGRIRRPAVGGVYHVRPIVYEILEAQDQIGGVAVAVVVCVPGLQQKQVSILR
eukprot:scaffold339481_cov32-Prasinocladus_malaysianus.AAC.1